MISAQIPRADLQKQTEADNIQAAWSRGSHFPSEAELKTAAQLAQEGYLSSVRNLRIVNKNISEIPSHSLAKLSSIVTYRAYINNSTLTEGQLSSILASVQSKELWPWNMKLSDENTRALVTAMSRVEYVQLVNVTLDPELLAAYDGQGHCTKLELYGAGGDTRAKYWARLRRWAADRGWTVTRDDRSGLAMERLGQSTPNDSQGIHILY